MAADSLLTAVHATASDSANVVNGINLLVGSWGIPGPFIHLITGAMLGLPAIVLVLLTRIPVFQWIAPPFHAWLDPIWERNKTWVNPVLVLLAAWLTSGNPAVGAIAVFAHQLVTGAVKAAKGTKATVAAGSAAAGAAALVLGLALGSPQGPPVASAATLPALSVVDSAGATLPWLSVHRFSLVAAVGESYVGTGFTDNPTIYGRWNVGYQAFPFLQLTAGQRRALVSGAPWTREAEARLVFHR